VVEAEEQNGWVNDLSCMPQEKEPNAIKVDRAANIIHLPCLNALLPQPPIHTSNCLLHLIWASLGYLIQLSGRLSVSWLAGYFAMSLFLAQLHSHLSHSSFSPSPGILRLWKLSTTSREGLQYIRSALGSYGKSVPRSTPPGLPPQLC
jgi:hypothetical protein